MGKFNKAWVAAAVSFVAMTAANWFGFTIDESMQAAIISVITGFFTWFVPNKA